MIYHGYDPYFKKHRRWQRGNGPRASLKSHARAVAENATSAQQQIERWLNNRGHHWRTLEKVIHVKFKGDWRKIREAMVDSFGYSESASVLD